VGAYSLDGTTVQLAPYDQAEATATPVPLAASIAPGSATATNARDARNAYRDRLTHNKGCITTCQCSDGLFNHPTAPITVGWGLTCIEATALAQAKCGEFARYHGRHYGCWETRRLVHKGNGATCGETLEVVAPDPMPAPTPPVCSSVDTSDGCTNTTACPLTNGRASCTGTSSSAREQTATNIEGTKLYKCTNVGWRACR
jgi:hypothetical protein